MTNLAVIEACPSYGSSLKVLKFSLLPYLNKCSDYSFIDKDQQVYCLKAFKTLNLIMKEQEEQMTVNYVLFSFWL